MRVHLANINAKLRILLANVGWVDPISHRSGLSCLVETGGHKHKQILICKHNQNTYTFLIDRNAIKSRVRAANR